MSKTKEYKVEYYAAHFNVEKPEADGPKYFGLSAESMPLARLDAMKHIRLMYAGSVTRDVCYARIRQLPKGSYNILLENTLEARIESKK